MTAKILNRARLARKLRRLPKISRQLIRQSLEISANEIVALARSLVPIDTGALRDSIGWTWGRPPTGAIVLADARVDDQLTLTIFAGNDEAFYARWQEFGTVNMPANPFFFVSYRALRSRTRRRISRAYTKSAKIVAASK